MIRLQDGMILYHGSYTEVANIDLCKCEAGKDFGQGFYLTSSFVQAQHFIPLSVKKFTENAMAALEFLRSEPYDPSI